MEEDTNWGGMAAKLRQYGERLTQYERSVINLIASDNAYPKSLSEDPAYSGYMIQEGLLGKRPFAGAQLHDAIEDIAVKAACNVFGAEHANVQPHSCSQANQAVYHALLKSSDAVLALGFQAGGHLTHGLKSNFSGRAYNFAFYGTTNDSRIDYDSAQDIAFKTSPKLIVCGSSSYPRLFDAKRLRSIADGVGARLMFDLSHEAGLIAGGVIPNPVPLADVVTMSIDKTLRGPFGGLVLCRQEIADSIDKAVHPGTQSSFSVRKISDAAQALILTQGQEFKEYAKAILENAKSMEGVFSQFPEAMVTGGTDKHYIVLDVKRTFGLNGETAEKKLEAIGILSNRQTLPSDVSRRMADSSGLRVGSAWVTSRGYTVVDSREVAKIICQTLSLPDGADAKAISDRVRVLATRERAKDVWLQKPALT